MNYLGVDYGRKRIGVSICHGGVGVVLPMQAIMCDPNGGEVLKLCALVKEHDINVVVVGYPVTMAGSIGSKAKEVDKFIEVLGKMLPGGVKICRADERLSSEEAHEMSRSFEPKKSAYKQRKQRRLGVIDSKAAVVILNDFLAERVGESNFRETFSI